MRRAVALIFIAQASFIRRDDSGVRVLGLDEWIDWSRAEPPARGIAATKVTLHAPDVLLLSGYDRPSRHEVRFSRKHVLQRDGCRCQYCGGVFAEAELNLDHVVPRERGGRTSWENIVTACLRCNAMKADRLPHQAGMRLARAPSRPSWRAFATRSFSAEERGVWRHFWLMDEKKPPGLPAVSNGTGSQTETNADKCYV